MDVNVEGRFSEPLQGPPKVNTELLAELVAQMLGQQSADIIAYIDQRSDLLSAQVRALEAFIRTEHATPGSAACFTQAPADRLEDHSAWAPEPGKSAQPGRTVEASQTLQAGPDKRSGRAGKAPPRITLPDRGGRAERVRIDAVTIAVFDTKSTWHGWSFYQGARMKPAGEVVILQDHSTPGVVTSPIDLPSGGLYRISVEAVAKAAGSRATLVLRAVDGDGGEHLGPDIQVAPGHFETFLFVPHRVERMRIYAILVDPEINFSFYLHSVKLDQVDMDSYYKSVSAKLPAPVIASMASVPARRAMLRDAVGSLLLQCDVVRVFLNDYPDVPEFLDHPRIEFRRSQDWDDKGDAGKFGWIDASENPGFRVIVDDDLIFPPDFCERMIGSLGTYAYRAIAAVHGVLLKQPLANYYDPESRCVQYFEGHAQDDTTVHVLGTNAMMYYSDCVRLRWDDFMFRNMADMFLARYAQDNAIPMISVKRPRLWVRQNKQAGGFETIYDSSLKRTKSKFDSSMVQDAFVKHIAPLTLQPTHRPKVAFVLFATSVPACEAAIESWLATRRTNFDWVLVVVAATGEPELARPVAVTSVACELHVIASEDMTPAGRVDAAFTLVSRLKIRFACLASDAVRFVSDMWATTLVETFGGALPAYVFAKPADNGVEVQTTIPAMDDMAFALLDGRLMTASPPAGGDSSSAAERLEDHLRVAVTRGGPLALTEDVSKLSNMLGVSQGYRDAIVALAATPFSTPNTPQAQANAAILPLTVNEFFERVVVINLNRRPDRLELVEASLASAGIRADRFAAVDKISAEIAAEYEAYASLPLATVPQKLRPILSSRDYYFHYDSQRCRVAYLEKEKRRKAIETAGAWAYLRSWEAILEQAISDRVDSLLVFDDDVVMHRRAPAIFAAAIGGLPQDWLILQLGTLQYEWSDAWISQRTRFLYSTNGSAIGSHAVGLRFDVLPFLLDQVKRMELPFDTGALSAATRAFPDRSFVILPNIAVQRLADSEICTSAFQTGKGLAEIAETYRWQLQDYDF